jgi:hypothetical protein
MNPGAAESRQRPSEGLGGAWAGKQASSDKAELEDDRGPGRQRASWGCAAHAGRVRRRVLMKAAGLGLAGLGYGTSLDGRKASLAHRHGARAAIRDSNRFWRFLRLGYHKDKGPPACENPTLVRDGFGGKADLD